MAYSIQTIKDFGDGWIVDAAHRFPCTKSSTYLAAPSLIVLHWTAAPKQTIEKNRERIRKWAARDSDKSSTHLSILRDGSVWQLVQLTRAAWHAGKSSWVTANGKPVPPSGTAGVNRYSIGIDFDLVGPVSKIDDMWFDSYNNKFDGDVEYDAATKRWYELPTPEAMMACRMVLDQLRRMFPGIDVRDIVGHQDVSPGRKIDPGPFINRTTLGID